MEKKIKLELTKNGWWQELEALINSQILPRQLAMDLRELVDSYYCNHIPPYASDATIQLAKKHLSDGIILNGTPYDIVVFVPDSDYTDGRKFFTLQKKFPRGAFKKLDEIELNI
jgi:hypothetical protein